MQWTGLVLCLILFVDLSFVRSCRFVSGRICFVFRGAVVMGWSVPRWVDFKFPKLANGVSNSSNSSS